MGTIISVGGGEISRVDLGQNIVDSETIKIDREIILRSGKKHPQLVFIPTASGDAEGYCDNVRAYFGSLGAVVDVLYMINKRPSYAEIVRKIMTADIIYVGGGNTLKMMTIWRCYGVDQILWRAYKKGIVLSGISAGAICWFGCGNSDSRKFTSGSKKLIKVTGLGMVDALCCPHFFREPVRQRDLKRMMRVTSRIVAIALDDGAALEIVDDQWRVITGIKNAMVYKCYWHHGQYVKKEIGVSKKWAPLHTLLQKDM